MTPEEKERLERWKKDTLSTVTKEVAARSEEFRSRSMANFNAFVAEVGRKAVAGFLKAFDFTTYAEMDVMSDELKDAYAAFIVGALNAGLAVDHPYLVALIFSEAEEGHQFRMCVVDRRGVPGAHERVTPDFVPIIRIKNVPIGGKPEIRFRIADAEYLSRGDNLEDLYKL